MNDGYFPSVSEIAKSTNKSKGAIATSMNKLIKLNYVTRFSIGWYEPGPEMLKKIKQQNIRAALDEHDMIKRIVDDI